MPTLAALLLFFCTCSSENIIAAPSLRKRIHFANEDARRDLESEALKLPKANKLHERGSDQKTAKESMELKADNTSSWFWDPTHPTELKTDHLSNSTIVSNTTVGKDTSDLVTEYLFEHTNDKPESSTKSKQPSEIDDITISSAEKSNKEEILVEETVDSLSETEQTKRIESGLMLLSIVLVAATIAMVLLIRRRRSNAEQAAEVAATRTRARTEEMNSQTRASF